MLQIVDLSVGANATVGLDIENQVSAFRNLVRNIDGTSFAMVARRSGLPNHGESDHFSCIQDSEPEEMVVFQSNSVHLPLEVSAVGDFGLLVVSVVVVDSEFWEISATSIEETVSGGGQDSQMLEVSPGETRVSFESQGENSGSFWGCCRSSRVRSGASAVEIGGSDSGFRVSASVGESGSQGGGARLIVMSVLTVVDGGVDGDGPHGSGISITVAVVVFSSVTRGPDEDGSQTVSSFIDSLDDSSHRCISGTVDGLSVIGRTPGSGVDMDQVGFVSHGVGLDEISHVWLVEHSDSSNLGVVSNSDTADSVVSCCSDFSSTTSTVGVEPVIGVSGIGIRIVGREVVAGFSIEVVLQVWMHVVDSVIHDGGGDVLSCETHSPSHFDVEIESRFPVRLTSVLQVPLVRVERVGGRLHGREVELFFESLLQWSEIIRWN